MVVHAHVKLFLQEFCPYLSHIPSMWISENNLKCCINAFYGTFNIHFNKKILHGRTLCVCIRCMIYFSFMFVLVLQNVKHPCLFSWICSDQEPG